ncbi:MAG: HAD family phosphatase, partial [Eubacteriales bacterium]|nr:HAD family phosphatase [Eubacteriales bacterium]
VCARMENDMLNYIFDMDGTLLDSMPYWRRLAREYLISKGISIPENFDEITYTMDLNESSRYFIEKFHINMTSEDMKEEVIELIKYHYAVDIPPKPGVIEFLKKKRDEGCRMCIFTTSDRKCAESSMKRLGVFECFENIFTVYDIGINKKHKESYIKICELMNFKPEETWVYEDVIHGVESAKSAGCKVAAVYDEDSAHIWKEISKKADKVIKDELMK